MRHHDFEFFARGIGQPVTRMHWNGHCNAFEIAAAVMSGLMEKSDVDRNDSRTRAHFQEQR